MKRSRVYLAVSLVIAATLGLWFGPRVYRSLQAGSLPDLLALAPADSTVIVYADVASLRGSPLVQRMEANAPSPKLDQDYTDFVSATGFDFQKDLDRFVLAVHSTGPATRTLIVAEGRFDRQKIAQYALRTGKSENHDGHTVYAMPSKASGKTSYFTFLEGNRLAISDGGDPSAVLAVARAPLDPALEQRLSRVSGSPLFAVAKVPDTSVGTTGPAAVSPTSPLQQLRWVSMAARPDGGEIIFSLEGECDGPEQAQKVAAALEFFRVLVRGGLNDPKARGKMSDQQAASLNRILTAASVTTDAARVRLLLTITPDMMGPSVPGATPPSH